MEWEEQGRPDVSIQADSLPTRSGRRIYNLKCNHSGAKVLLRLVTIIYGKVLKAMYPVFSKTNNIMLYHESWRKHLKPYFV